MVRGRAISLLGVAVRLGNLATLAAGVLLAAAVGCNQPPPVNPAERERGLVWMFPGIEGGPWSMQLARQGLVDAGVTAEVRIYDWSRPFNPLGNLTEYEGNRRKAVEIARELAAYRATHPEATIDLVGYSGGGGLAIMAVEALSESVRLRNVVLAQAALSPDYDLTAALRRIDGQLVNFYSPGDWFILGWGTQTFGTMDRKNVNSAGRIGFDLEHAAPDAALRAKVVQREWTADALRTGHIGSHLGILMYGWNRTYVAPYLLPERKTDDGAAAAPDAPASVSPKR